MRIIFMGTPDFAVPSLNALAAAGHDVVAAYTQPPRPAGRGKSLTPSPVHKRAEALGVAVRHPISLRNEHEQSAFAAINADIAVVAAYGLILPQAILDAPKHGCINVHASLLPRWRGAAPIHRAILAGDQMTGVTIMQMEAGLDTGPMLASISTPITDLKTTGGLTIELADLGARLLTTVLVELPNYPPVAQPDQDVTYAAKVEKSESKLSFNVGSEQVIRQIQAFNPAPGAWFEFQGERVRILNATRLSDGSRNFSFDFPTDPGVVLNDQLAIGCGSGAIGPMTVQRAGRSPMDAVELLRGFPIPVGTRLT